jgi:phosphoadenosine phosphosulfate reductase
MIYDAIKTAAIVADSVIVAFSGGKDSVVALDLCHRYFKKIFIYTMYHVAGLSFNESILQWAERRYKTLIYRIPHFDLSGQLKYGLFRLPDDDVPIININDIYAHVRKMSGLEWIAAGETISDSIWRRAMIKKSGTIDFQRRRFYPIAYFRKKHIMTYIKRNRLKYAPETKYIGHSFGNFYPKTLYLVKKHYPSDYKKIKTWFPFCESAVKRYELYYNK